MTAPLSFDDRARAMSALEAGKCRRLARAALAYEAVCGERTSAHYTAWLELTEAAAAMFPEIDGYLVEARDNCGLDANGERKRKDGAPERGGTLVTFMTRLGL